MSKKIESYDDLCQVLRIGRYRVNSVSFRKDDLVDIEEKFDRALEFLLDFVKKIMKQWSTDNLTHNKQPTKMFHILNKALFDGLGTKHSNVKFIKEEPSYENIIVANRRLTPNEVNILKPSKHFDIRKVNVDSSYKSLKLEPFVPKTKEKKARKKKQKDAALISNVSIISRAKVYEYGSSIIDRQEIEELISEDYVEKSASQIAEELRMTPEALSQNLRGQKRTKKNGMSTTHGGLAKKLDNLHDNLTDYDSELLVIYVDLIDRIDIELTRIRQFGYDLTVIEDVRTSKKTESTVKHKIISSYKPIEVKEEFLEIDYGLLQMVESIISDD